MAFQRAYGSYCWLKACHIVFGTPVKFYTVRGTPSKIRRYSVRRGGRGYSLMYHGNLPSVKYAPPPTQIMMIKVRHTDCQLFACVRRVQSDFMEGIYCNKYQWGPKIRNLISVSTMTAASRSDCWIFVIFTSKQLWTLQMLII